MVVLLLVALAACQTNTEQRVATTSGASSPLRLPDDDAGRVVARAIAAAGGWERWQAHRDASFISTLTLFDPLGNATSETIFLHKLPLHDGMKTRLESIGLHNELIFGFDGGDSWMLENGQAVTEPNRTAFTTFHGISMLYWFTLPFVLAELPGALSYVGAEADGERRWDKVRVEYHDTAAAPADWVVVYVDAQTGLIDRVHCHVTADFLRQSLWVGNWRDYRTVEGIKHERRRTFFPADLGGAAVGGMAAEQIVEHVHFDNNFPRELFTRPLAAGGGSPAG